MVAMSNKSAIKALEIKISTVVAVLAIVRDTDLTALDGALRDMTGGEADYFDNEFAVLDFSALELGDGSIDWAALIALFKSYRLNPVAVRHAPEALHAVIQAHGLSIDVVARPRQDAAPAAAPAASPEPAAPVARAVAAQPAPAAPAVPAAPLNSMIIDTPVRAGQRVYARGCDLVVMAVVNSGGEVIADGSIHVYAPFRGRALAGASGNAEARIFAMSMEAELVSIAGIYRTFDDGLPKELAQQAVQVRLVGDRLDLIAMNPTR
jgi:septum site-determining protein MinC